MLKQVTFITVSANRAREIRLHVRDGVRVRFTADIAQCLGTCGIASQSCPVLFFDSALVQVSSPSLARRMQPCTSRLRNIAIAQCLAVPVRPSVDRHNTRFIAPGVIRNEHALFAPICSQEPGSLGMTRGQATCRCAVTSRVFGLALNPNPACNGFADFDLVRWHRREARRAIGAGHLSAEQHRVRLFGSIVWRWVP